MGEGPTHRPPRPGGGGTAPLPRVVVSPAGRSVVDPAADGSEIGDDTLGTQPSAPTSNAAAPGSLVGAVLANKYRLDRLLGAGGMGEVYLGEHLALGARIAVKTMHGRFSGDPTFVGRFRREARAVASLNHPNIVRVLDFGADEQFRVSFLVMEYLEGQSLGDALGRRTIPPNIEDVVAVLLPLLDALGVAHAAGVVHRDLKPDNVFLVDQPDGGFTVKIVDFGLAHMDDPGADEVRLTREGVVAGTPAYMSPEQCKSLAVGPSTDIYAVGCILTELLQLAPPFKAQTSMELFSKQLFAPPPPLDRAGDLEPVPPLLERLRLELLAKREGARPASAGEIARRLREATTPELADARLPPRQGDAIGDRQARAPIWDAPAEARPADAAAPRGRVALVRLVEGEDGVSPLCEVGLLHQGLDVSAVKSLDKAVGADAVVVDAGADHASAEAAVRHFAVASPSSRVVVCVAGLDTERMSALIAAGAADVARYPIAPDVLAKKVARALRRKR